MVAAILAVITFVEITLVETSGNIVVGGNPVNINTVDRNPIGGSVIVRNFATERYIGKDTCWLNLLRL